MLDVILANYNHSNSIMSAIDALNNQSLRPHRIYIIDDASTDDSWEKLILASQKYENIELIRNFVNEGANNSYNKGLKLCTSDLIYFAAADDVTCPELFEKCTKALLSNPKAAFAVTEAILFDIDKKRLSMRPIVLPKIIGKLMTPDKVKKEFKSNENWIMTGACVFKTELVKESYGLNIKLGAFSDSMLAKKLAFRYGCIFLKYTGVRWNITKSGFSRSLYKDYEEFAKLKSELQIFIESNTEFPIWYWDKFSKHLVFNEIRLGSLNWDSSLSGIDKNFSRIIFLIYLRRLSSEKIFRSIILFIVFMKLKPYTLPRVMYTYLSRFFGKKF